MGMKNRWKGVVRNAGGINILSTRPPPGSGTNRCPGTTDWRQERQRWSLAARRHRAAAAMAATDEWVWQGANLLLVVTASGVVFVCVCCGERSETIRSL